ncbi:hypothetical protein EYM_02580 [Ignicoccus islandicus DSM 13165]|uniref:Uncharacterized protein n=1 Tax=Ignicoccus islandicus DSM 13165 TaxID=940295 RepID=A0A0U3ED13_9CREN|nr:hypothetical protein [Ignicoccus islandicus]ALU12339.1 hypothetical protein EYM_02580 [Ignicoccus islandicus DSM 13165]
MIGELLKVADIEIDGGVEIVTSLKVEDLNGESRRSTDIPLSFTIPEEASIEKMFLDLTVVGETRNWRVYIGDFSLTKEFKPTLSGSMGNSIIHKFIFDVTPTKHVVLSDPVLRVVNNSNSPIKVIQSSIVVFYSYKDLGQAHYYYGVSMRPFRALSGSLDPVKSGKIYSVVYSRDRNNIKAKVGPCVSEVSFVGTEEIELECSKGGGYALEGTSEFVPLTLVLGSFSYNLPKLTLETDRSSNKIKIVIKNEGSKADKVLVILYSSGAVLDRKDLGELNEGEAKELEFETGKFKDVLVMGIRLLWVKGKMRGTVDKLIPL